MTISKTTLALSISLVLSAAASANDVTIGDVAGSYQDGRCASVADGGVCNANTTIENVQGDIYLDDDTKLELDGFATKEDVDVVKGLAEASLQNDQVLAGKMEGNTADILDLEGRVDTAEGEIDALQTGQTAQDERMDLIEQTGEAYMAGQQQKDASQDADIAANGESITDLQSGQNDLVNRMNANDNLVDSVRSTASIASSRSLDNKYDIDALEAGQEAQDQRLDLIEEAASLNQANQEQRDANQDVAIVLAQDTADAANAKADQNASDIAANDAASIARDEQLLTEINNVDQKHAVKNAEQDQAIAENKQQIEQIGQDSLERDEELLALTQSVDANAKARDAALASQQDQDRSDSVARDEQLADGINQVDEKHTVALSEYKQVQAQIDAGQYTSIEELYALDADQQRQLDAHGNRLNALEQWKGQADTRMNQLDGRMSGVLAQMQANANARPDLVSGQTFGMGLGMGFASDDARALAAGGAYKINNNWGVSGTVGWSEYQYDDVVKGSRETKDDLSVGLGVQFAY